mmetsp:Transcript_163373/g.523815  ORF Transcript_163373/g.523815 Transcript_163373/m.523815 type:complete len:223 (+) Transcript_163373:286-954(+)
MRSSRQFLFAARLAGAQCWSVVATVVAFGGPTLILGRIQAAQQHGQRFHDALRRRLLGALRADRQAGGHGRPRGDPASPAAVDRVLGATPMPGQGPDERLEVECGGARVQLVVPFQQCTRDRRVAHGQPIEHEVAGVKPAPEQIPKRNIREGVAVFPQEVVGTSSEVWHESLQELLATSKGEPNIDNGGLPGTSGVTRQLTLALSHQDSGLGEPELHAADKD